MFVYAKEFTHNGFHATGVKLVTLEPAATGPPLFKCAAGVDANLQPSKGYAMALESSEPVSLGTWK